MPCRNATLLSLVAVPSRSPRDEAKLQSLKARLAQCEIDLATQTARYAALRREQKDERAAARTRSRLLAHRIPSEIALWVTLPERVSAMREAASATPSPVLPPLPDSEMVSTCGLTLWVPREVRIPGKLADRVLRGWLPLREIAEARDVAVGAIMIDIGANIGTTVIPRIAMGDFFWAFAAEAEPANVACLQRSVAANGLDQRIAVDHVAIASYDGEIALAVSAQIGTHRVIKDDEPRRGTITVPCRRLDTWVAERQIDLALTTFIKCDVEGSEMSVLSGAPNVLAHRHIAWQLEFSPSALVTQGVAPADFLTLVASKFGYFIDLHGDGLRERCRSTSQLATSLGYVGGEGAGHTDLLLFNGAAPEGLTR